MKDKNRYPPKLPKKNPTMLLWLEVFRFLHTAVRMLGVVAMVYTMSTALRALAGKDTSLVVDFLTNVKVSAWMAGVFILLLGGTASYQRYLLSEKKRIQKRRRERS